MTLPDLDVWGLVTIATKFALYLGVLAAAGTTLAALVFRFNNYRNLCLTFGSLGLLAAIFAFLLPGANLTGDASGMIDPEMLGLLWDTPVGTALMYRIAGLGLLIIGLFMGRIGLWLSVIGGIVAIWSFDHIGHVAGRKTTLLDIILILHLIAIALWIGVLTPLKRLTSKPRTWRFAADVGHRFGLVASVTVPLLIIAGLYMSYELVGSFTALVGTGYGQALILKVVLVAGLLVLGALNKLYFVPGLQANEPKAARRLASSITIEWIIILAVLGITSILTSNLTLPT
jgi:putative copper resistance protein D